MIRCSLAAALLTVLLPGLASAQTTPVVKWKTPASWNIDVFGGRTYSTLTVVSGDPARAAKRQPGWVAGATFGRYDGRRIGFDLQLLIGRQRATELLFDAARPADYSMHFVEVPLLVRFDPLRRKNSGGLVSLFGGVGIGRRFHVERTFDAHVSAARWAMYADVIAGGSVDLRRVILNVEYLNGLTKFAPASGATGAKHFRSLLVTAGYEVKRGPMPRGAEGGWDVELHAGGLLGSPATGGAGQLPLGGATIPTTQGLLSTRRVSSWLVGDGTQLFNQATTILLSRQTITPLDAVIAQSSAQRQSGAMFGVRLTRPIASRVAAELTLDLAATPVAIDRAGLDGIEASRASFVAGFQSLLANGIGGLTSSNVTATTELHNGEGRQILFTAGALVRVTRERTLTPYVRGGVGMAMSKNGTSAIVRGTYDFRAIADAPFHESDVVTMKFSSGSSALGIAGAGATYRISERTGLRFDAGWCVSRNLLKTTVSTAASKTTNTVPFAVVVVGHDNQAIQFVNFSSTTTPSSLSGTPLQDFQTFRGAGLQMQTAMTVGIYRRF